MYQRLVLNFFNVRKLSGDRKELKLQQLQNICMLGFRIHSFACQQHGVLPDQLFGQPRQIPTNEKYYKCMNYIYFDIITNIIYKTICKAGGIMFDSIVMSLSQQTLHKTEINTNKNNDHVYLSRNLSVKDEDIVE